MSAQRAPFSLPLCITFEALILLAYTVKPSWYRPLLFIPIAVIGIYIVFFTSTGGKADAGVGNAVMTHIFCAFDGLVVRDVQRVLHRVGEKPGQITSAGFMARFAWACQLHNNPRGINWNYEIPRLRQGTKPTQSRKSFFLSRLYALLIYVVLGVAFLNINPANPALIPGAKALQQQSLYIRVLSALGLGVPAMAAINAQHIVLSIVTVALGISQPADWPPLFGSVKDIYTVANVWGSIWHQLLRNSLSSTASFVIHSVLHIPRLKPNSSQKAKVSIGLLKIHLVFLLSAIIHASGEFMVTGYASLGSFTFFVLQAWAITLELGVQYLFSSSILRRNDKKSPALIWRMVGYIWTLSWLLAVSPLLQQPMVEGGLFLGTPGSALTQKVGRWLALDTI